MSVENLLTPQVLIAIISTIGGGFAVMWRQAVAESKRKDVLIDRKDQQIDKLVEQIARTADAQLMLVSVHERERTHR